MKAPEFGNVVQSFFSDHLLQQKRVSPRTLSAYRDTFRPLLQYLSRHQSKNDVSRLGWSNLDAETVLGFLDHLEKQRGNTARTRNLRLAAIRSFVRYALAFKNLEYLPVTQQILAIPLKRFARPLLGFLSREEMQSVLDAPDQCSSSGHRDRVLFTLLYNTGARISEIIQLRVEDVIEGSVHASAPSRCHAGSHRVVARARKPGDHSSLR
jgi:integrase/recombinase XerD